MRRPATVTVGSLLALGALSPALAQCPSGWSLASAGQPTVPNDPPVRQNHAAVYDAAHQTVLMFGGFLAGTGFRGDTWLWDGNTWALGPAAGPSARGNLAMAYDSARERVVLFGGATVGGGFFADTWEWDGRDWIQMNPVASPPGRFNHAMAYDSDRRVVVMTGGFSTVRYSDTWEYDGSVSPPTWTERTNVGTYGGRNGHGMVYDRSRQRMVVFGGFNGARINDTRELTPTGWVQITVPAPLPQGRQYLGMDYDTDQHLVVLWGGQIGPLAADRAQDTWVYNGTTWTEVVATTPPPKRDQHTLSYDQFHHRFVVFGGFQGTGFGGTVGDTWQSACAGCYPNCDGSTGSPALNVNDFICFQSRFAAADPYADCNHDSALNVLDFICFQSSFAAGCP